MNQKSIVELDAIVIKHSFHLPDPTYRDSGGGLFGNPDTVGYNVITPFVVDGTGGKSILVNRGWVPKKRVNPSTRQQGQVS